MTLPTRRPSSFSWSYRPPELISFAATWLQDPGAQPHSITVKPGSNKLYFSWIWRSLYALRQRYPSLKVSWFWKQILKLSFEPKTDRKYFSISALASKKGQIRKITAHSHASYWLFLANNMIWICFVIWRILKTKGRNRGMKCFLFKWKLQNLLSKLTDL